MRRAGRDAEVMRSIWLVWRAFLEPAPALVVGVVSRVMGDAVWRIGFARNNSRGLSVGRLALGLVLGIARRGLRSVSILCI